MAKLVLVSDVIQSTDRHEIAEENGRPSSSCGLAIQRLSDSPTWRFCDSVVLTLRKMVRPAGIEAE